LLWQAVKDIGSLLWPARFSVAVLLVAIPFLVLLPPSQDALLALVAGANRGSQIIFAAVSLFWALETYYWADFMSRLPARPKAPRPRGQEALLSPARLEALNRWLPRLLGLFALLVVGGAALKANRGNSTNTFLVWIGLAIDIALYILLCWRPGAPLSARGVQLWQRLRRPATPAADRRPASPPASATPPQRSLFATEQAAGLPAAASGRRRRAAAPPPSWGWPSWAAVAVLAVVTLAACIAGGSLATETRQLVAVGLTLGWLVMICAFVFSLRESDIDRRTKFWVLVNLVVFAVIMIASIEPAPVLIGRAPTVVTSPSVILSVFAAWVFLGSFFIALPGERFRVPVLTILALLAIVWSFLFADNHDLRLRPEPHPPSLTLDEALTRFTAGRTEPVPLVIVATAGGASRAGYWTAKILGELEDAHPGFHKSVFAISSVSGGTLGAGVWRAMLEDGAAPCPAGSFAACARRFFCQDFLGPTLLTGLYADLTQRLLPGSLLPDRGTALEQAWEAAWGKLMTTSKVNRMEGGFHDLTPKEGNWRPLLLINGTSVKSGRRIITSQLEIAPKSFPDAVDFFHFVGSELRLSTALHNSARFPYIDTAGNIRLAGDGRSLLVDRIVDGGYFENFGAATAGDLLQSLQQSAWRPRIRPIVIQIGSDPAMLEPDKRDPEWRGRIGWWFNIASDTTVPPATFYDTRDALGYRATQNLERTLGLDWPTARFARFRLSDSRIPMSWAMSSFAISAIDDEWTKTPSDQRARAIVVDALWPGSTPPAASRTTSPGCADVP
jgi:hypothetical protein